MKAFNMPILASPAGAGWDLGMLDQLKFIKSGSNLQSAYSAIARPFPWRPVPARLVSAEPRRRTQGA
jgi:hypothetical protein